MATYETRVAITQAEMKYMTDLMQVNVPTPKEVTDGAPLATVEAPAFQNKYRARFYVLKSGKADYNILNGSVFDADGKAITGYPLDCSDMEDFNNRMYGFQIGDDEYSIVMDVS
jgi:hypothetical protein